MMRRRELAIATAVLATVLPFFAGVAEAKTYRVGFLSPGGFAPGTDPGILTAEIEHQLTRGRLNPDSNIEIVKRGAEGHPDRLSGLLAELVAAKVDAIVTFSYPVAAAAKEGTSTVPIVAFLTGDPVKTHLVASLNRPGANLTGISDDAAELAPKRLELLKAAAPSLQRVAMLWNANDLGMNIRYEASAAVATKLGISVQSFGVHAPDDLRDAFGAMEHEKPDGLFMVADPLTFLNRKRVFDFAAEHRIPAIYETEVFSHDGGLMSYGPDGVETAERGASLVLRILNGERPADLPLEQPTRFRLVINLNTAKALGLTVPQSLLARADEVIE